MVISKLVYGIGRSNCVLFEGERLLFVREFVMMLFCGNLLIVNFVYSVGIRKFIVLEFWFCFDCV